MAVLCQNGGWAANQNFNENLRLRLDFRGLSGIPHAVYLFSTTVQLASQALQTNSSDKPQNAPAVVPSSRKGWGRAGVGQFCLFQGCRVSQPGASPTVYCLKSGHFRAKSSLARSSSNPRALGPAILCYRVDGVGAPMHSELARSALTF